MTYLIPRLHRSVLLALALLVAGCQNNSQPAGVAGKDAPVEPPSGTVEVTAPSKEVKSLAAEVRAKGWIVFSAPSKHGDWDLYLMRPDGSERRALTQTPEWNEAWPQFSRDGSKLLYRRLKRGEPVSGNDYGAQGTPIVANSDGSNPRALGADGDLPWATWSPDGKELATLSVKGISLVDAETGKVRRTFPRQGFFQQLTWSPDGKWLVGVANNFGTGWSIARLDAATGEVNAVNKVDCCTPDWFPDSGNVIFSWRPPGQKTNRGQGWTQLWRADAEGKEPRLVYAKDDRHAYGSFVSPDGKYVIFTGNLEEDGDPAHGGGPMSLMRLSDAAIVEGDSPGVRALHPEAKNGPILTLATGWEPCWTFSEKPAGSPAKPDTAGLAREIHKLGWIAFSAVGDAGDWDLYVMRPDGADRRKLTDTREFNETGGRFSPDGKRLLYYRQPAKEPVDNNTYGTFELMIADANGTNAISLGRDFPWASWGPDSKSIATLTQRSIRIVDVATRKIVRTLPRNGFCEQLVWSPDGHAFVGTANGLGQFWNIGVADADRGKISTVSETERYNCTPDWMPDSRHVVYARGTVPDKNERAQLWMAAPDGRDRHMLYAEAGRHVYGGASSPDGRYFLFTRSVEDLGKVDHAKTTMAIIRAADTPMLGDEDRELRKRFPNAKPAIRFDLGPGWEPHWTQADVPLAK
jgi:Tol biopolymer transport system component